jgi:hypothetical protein
MTGAVAVLASYGAELPAVLVLNLDPSAQGAMPGASITTSASFNGSSQYLSTTGGSLLGDFTVEGWFSHTTGTGTLFSLGSEAAGRFVVALEGTQVTTNFYGEFGNVDYGISISINTWTHIAVVRSGTTIKIYSNGVAAGVTETRADTIGNGPLNLGADSNGTNLFAGYITNFRIVTSALYTTNFITPTVTLRAVAGTQLLLPLTATPFMDVSTNLFTVTNNGTVVTAGNAPSITAATTDVTGTYSLTTVNAGATPIAWSSNNGGVFRKTSTTTTDRITLPIDYSLASQGYTVFLAYKLTPASTSSGSGRILSANTDSPDWLLGSYAPGSPGGGTAYASYFSNSWYANDGATNYNGAGSGGVFSGGVNVWNFVWATFNGTTKVAKKYVASATVNNASGPPSAVLTTTLDSNQHGFNGLRLWNRFNTFEPAMGDIGVIRVYNRAATLAQVQEMWTAYHTRFGI